MSTRTLIGPAAAALAIALASSMSMAQGTNVQFTPLRQAGGSSGIPAPAAAAVAATSVPFAPAPQVAATGLNVVAAPFDERQPLPMSAPPTPAAAGVVQAGKPYGDTDAPLPIKAAAPAVQPRWDVAIADVTLLGTFNRWAATAGWRVKWDAARHILIDAPGSITGTFESAIEQVLASPGISRSDYPLEVCFFSNKVARVTRRGDQTKDCL